MNYISLRKVKTERDSPHDFVSQGKLENCFSVFPVSRAAEPTELVTHLPDGNGGQPSCSLLFSLWV